MVEDQATGGGGQRQQPTAAVPTTSPACLLTVSCILTLASCKASNTAICMFASLGNSCRSLPHRGLVPDRAWPNSQSWLKLYRCHCFSIPTVILLIIPSAGKMDPTIINKGQLIESIGDHTRILESGVRARSNSRGTLPADGIPPRPTRETAQRSREGSRSTEAPGTMQCLPKLLGRQVSREGVLPARQRMPSYKPIRAYSTTWRIREAVQKSLYTPQTSSQNQLWRLGGADRGAEAWGVSL